MRALIAIALLGAVVGDEVVKTEDSWPVLDWLKEHGKDVFETVMECKDLPSVFREAQSSECRATPTPLDAAALVTWKGVSEMEKLNATLPDIFQHHLRMLEKLKSLATMRLIFSTHKSAAKYCEHPQCASLSQKIMAKISPCYASLTCDFLSKFVPFGVCKSAMERYMDGAMGLVMDTFCESDKVRIDGKPLYCAEISSDVMYRDFDCFIEFKSAGVQKCTPKCTQEWQRLQAKSPTCSKIFNDQTTQLYQLMRSTMQSLAEQSNDENFKKALEHMPKTLATYNDVCNHGAPSLVV